MEDFNVQIESTSREISKRERVKIKDTSNAVKIDEATAEGDFVIKPDVYAILQIHNAKSKDNPDYRNIVILDDAGNKFVTGSPSFIKSFIDIWNEMEGEEDWEIVCYQRESKNYKGKYFLSCSVL